MKDIHKAIQARNLAIQQGIGDTFSKGKALPNGTIRKRPNGNFIKTPMGWKYHSKNAKSVAVGTAAKEASNGDEKIVVPEGDIARFNSAQKITGQRFYSGAKLFRGEEGAKRYISEIKKHQAKQKKTSTSKIDKEKLTHLQNTRNDFYNRGFKEQGDKVQADIDKLGGKKTHIGDMSLSDKQKAAKKLGIDIKGKTDAQLSKLMISANVDKQIADFKKKKGSKKSFPQNKISSIESTIDSLSDRIQRFSNIPSSKLSHFDKKTRQSLINQRDRAQGTVDQLKINMSGAKSLLKEKFNLGASTKSSTAIRGYNRYSKGYEIDKLYDSKMLSFHQISSEKTKEIGQMLKDNGFEVEIQSSSITINKYSWSK